MVDDAELFAPTIFDTDGKYGQLSYLVVQEHDQIDKALLHPEVAKARFVDAGCPSAACLLDWTLHHLKREKVIFENLMVRIVSDENGGLMREVVGGLQVGLPHIGISAGLWLLYLAARIDDVSAMGRGAFEDVCSEFMLMEDDRVRRKGAHTVLN